MSEVESSIKVIIFSGKKRDWTSWEEKFLSRALQKGYKRMLLGKEKVPKDFYNNDDEKADDGFGGVSEEDLEKLRRLNEKAYSDLVLSITTDNADGRVAFNLVRGTKSSEFENGNCYLAFKRLRDKYQPKSAPSLTKVTSNFYKSSLRKGQDPSVFITFLEDLRLSMEEMGNKITDKQFIIQVLNNLTEEYEYDVSYLERLKDDELTIEKVREELSLRYERLHNKRSDNNDKEKEETALYAGSKFKGKCIKCGKYGHKAVNCHGSNKPSDGSNAEADKKKNIIKCFYCDKPGHKISQCYKKKKDESEKANGSKEQNGEKAEVCLMTFENVLSQSKFQPKLIKEYSLPLREGRSEEMKRNIWIADTGASTHMGNSDAGMTDVTMINAPITIGDGKVLYAEKIGRKHATIIQQDGSLIDVVLQDYKYVPGLHVNLFSLTKCLKNGWNIGNEDIKLYVRKGDVKITFDQKIQTEKGFIVGVEIVPREIYNNNEFVNVATMTEGRTLSVKYFHQILGHPSLDTTRRTAKFYGIKLTGTMDICENCGLGKSKREAVKKISESSSKIPGERLFIDISSIQAESFGGSKYWLLILDDFTGVSWSYFLKKKSDLSERVMELLKDLKSKHNIKVKFVRCDNAGENKKLEELCLKEGLGIQFEFTTPDTPEYNGKVERKFATLYGRVRAMLNSARLTKRLREGLWAEAASTAQQLENALVTDKRDQPSYNQFFKKEYPGFRNRHPFGELAIVNYGDENKIKSKLSDRGRVCIYLGHAVNHPQDAHRFFNIQTEKVIISRNVVWLGKNYGTWKGLQESGDPTIFQGYDSDEEEDESEPRHIEQVENNNMDAITENENNNVNEINHDINRPRRGWKPSLKVLENMAQELDNEEQEGDDRRGNDLVHAAMTKVILKEDFALICKEDLEGNVDNNKKDNVEKYQEMKPGNVPKELYKDIFECPKTFHEAYDHKDLFLRNLWREAIKKEFHKMIELKVWKRIKQDQIPSNRCCVKCKWVFDIKRDGKFHARLVACGYSQIPGVDFTEIYSPVINDGTVRLLLVSSIIYGHKTILVDIETAFLHGILEEDIYMELPEGIKFFQRVENGDALKLIKTIYGLVQASQEFNKKMTKVLESIGFEQSKADPCLFVKTIGDDKVFLALWVDDCYLQGKEENIRIVTEDLSKHFKLKIQNDLEDYLSCEIKFGKGNCWIGQPHLIKKIEKNFGKLVENLQVYCTPGTPGFYFITPSEQEKLTPEEQTVYRSGIGMLLFLIKYSRPDIANSVRELSKGMQVSYRGAMKELLRLIKFVLDTKDLGLKLEPKEVGKEWIIKVYSDSDWAGDKETCKSVTGYIIFLFGCPIAWKSIQQKVISLSSSEAEFYACSEAVKEVKFIYQVITTMKIKVKLPIEVFVDNIGAIFMAENLSVSKKTKHIDL
jgi:hypothetical protein